MDKYTEVYSKLISETRLVAPPDSNLITLIGTVTLKLINKGSKSEQETPFLIMGDNEIRIHLESDPSWFDPELKKYEGKIITVKCFVYHNQLIIREIINNEY